MPSLAVAKKLVSRRIVLRAEREKAGVAIAAGFISSEAVRSRAIRMVGVLLKIMLTTGTAGQGFTAANAKLSDFSSEGAAVLNALGTFETIDGLAAGYLAEIEAIETIEELIVWEAMPRSWS